MKTIGCAGKQLPCPALPLSGSGHASRKPPHLRVTVNRTSRQVYYTTQHFTQQILYTTNTLHNKYSIIFPQSLLNSPPVILATLPSPCYIRLQHKTRPRAQKL